MPWTRKTARAAIPTAIATKNLIPVSKIIQNHKKKRVKNKIKVKILERIFSCLMPYFQLYFTQACQIAGFQLLRFKK
jgi:hypothetical protein